MTSPSVVSAPGPHPPLSKAPVSEAVFEFRRPHGTSFSLLPGAMAEPLRGLNYAKVVETELGKIGAWVELPPEAGILVTHQFCSADDKNLVQLGPRGFTVNSVAYPGFEAFREAVAKVLDVYLTLAKPESVTRLGLRYLNTVPATEGRLLASFTVKQDWPHLEGSSPKSLAARMLLSYADPPGQLGIAVVDPAPKASLDLDFFHSPEKAMTVDEVLSWVDRAHERVYEAFRGMVRPELFEAWK